LEVCQGGNRWIYTLIDPVVTIKMWMRTTAGNRADNPQFPWSFHQALLFIQKLFSRKTASQPAKVLSRKEFSEDGRTTE